MSTISADAYDLKRGVENEPLTPEEIRMVNRLLSDPTILPRDFKRWVTDHSSDTVDITKSQVHGLINSQGNIYIPPPPLVSQVYYATFATLVTLTGGSGGPIFVTPSIECDGNPVIWEFYAPFCEYNELKFTIQLDGANQGWIANLRLPYNQAAQSAPDQTLVARAPLYISRQFTPSKGNHTFGLYGQSYGSRLHYIGGGTNIYGENFAPGFFRLSRA